jgi:hypothetical protein
MSSWADMRELNDLDFEVPDWLKNMLQAPLYIGVNF